MLPSMAIPEDGINSDRRAVKDRVRADQAVSREDRRNKRQAARLLHLSRTTLIDKLNRLSQPKRRPDEEADTAEVSSPPAA